MFLAFPEMFGTLGVRASVTPRFPVLPPLLSLLEVVSLLKTVLVSGWSVLGLLHLLATPLIQLFVVIIPGPFSARVTNALPGGTGASKRLALASVPILNSRLLTETLENVSRSFVFFGCFLLGSCAGGFEPIENALLFGGFIRNNRFLRGFLRRFGLLADCEDGLRVGFVGPRMLLGIRIILVTVLDDI